MDFPLRLNKYLAQQGLASRREADALIAAGQILVNGQPATLGTKVQATDRVEVVGRTPAKIYLAYYKGRGIISHSPAPGETDIASRLAEDYQLTGLSPIGRLDKDSEGLILISNDGRLTAPLLDPKRRTEKEYEVTVDKPINHWFLKHMATGVKIERYQTKPTTVTLTDPKKLRFSIVLTEGKKHQIRRMCAALGYQVTTLKRIRFGAINLGKLKPNQYRKLTETEVATLLQKLKVT